LSQAARANGINGPRPLRSYRDLLKEKSRRLGSRNPVLEKSRAAEILELLEKAKQPMVIDADALKYLGGKKLRR